MSVNDDPKLRRACERIVSTWRSARSCFSVIPKKCCSAFCSILGSPSKTSSKNSWRPAWRSSNLCEFQVIVRDIAMLQLLGGNGSSGAMRVRSDSNSLYLRCTRVSSPVNGKRTANSYLVARPSPHCRPIIVAVTLAGDPLRGLKNTMDSLDGAEVTPKGDRARGERRGVAPLPLLIANISSGVPIHSFLAEQGRYRSGLPTQLSLLERGHFLAPAGVVSKTVKRSGWDSPTFGVPKSPTTPDVPILCSCSHGSRASIEALRFSLGTVTFNLPPGVVGVLTNAPSG
mmetsp:Transcript_52024/g.114161  ORF Transcript_52024/g.114161 Transcript_52024/m.114161 type:complete len:286 (+) Transcript_52024:2635-3492(+)